MLHQAIVCFNCTADVPFQSTFGIAQVFISLSQLSLSGVPVWPCSPSVVWFCCCNCHCGQTRSPRSRCAVIAVVGAGLVSAMISLFYHIAHTRNWMNDYHLHTLLLLSYIYRLLCSFCLFACLLVCRFVCWLVCCCAITFTTWSRQESHPWCHFAFRMTTSQWSEKVSDDRCLTQLSLVAAIVW